MTPEKQQIALCEWTGWKDIRAANEPSSLISGIPPNPAHDKHRELAPDTNSLDVIHEMEKKLDDDNHEFNQRWHYGAWLKRIVRPEPTMSQEADWFYAANATAPQRREALLRTLRLWED